AAYDRSLTLDVTDLAPQVTWGTSPQDALAIDARVPHPGDAADEGEAQRRRRALDYMGLVAGTALQDIAVDHVFIGSCTNGRIEDLRIAAEVAAGRRVAPTTRAIVVPGSTAVKRQAEAEGLDRIFTDA